VGWGRERQVEGGERRGGREMTGLGFTQKEEKEEGGRE